MRKNPIHSFPVFYCSQGSRLRKRPGLRKDEEECGGALTFYSSVLPHPLSLLLSSCLFIPLFMSPDIKPRCLPCSNRKKRRQKMKFCFWLLIPVSSLFFTVIQQVSGIFLGETWRLCVLFSFILIQFYIFVGPASRDKKYKLRVDPLKKVPPITHNHNVSQSNV